MSGLLSPDPRLRELNDAGLIQAGALLQTLVSGTPATPLATYSDVALTIPNTNPLVASAGGLFGPIYLTPGVAYKYVLTDADGNPLWSQDPVTAPSVLSVAALTNHGVVIGTATEALASTAAGTAGQVLTSNGAAADPTFQSVGASNGVNDFRLTLETGVPVSTSDQTAKTSIFCTPYLGNRIALYSAAGVASVLTSAEFLIAVPATTAQMYDIFAYSNAGVAALELLAWTNDTTRATALVRTTTGALTKSGDLTRRYLGSFRTTGVSGQTEDSDAKRYLWNYYNRVPKRLKVFEATDSWGYNTATYRQARATATNQVEAVIGWAEVEVILALTAMSKNDTAPDNTFVSISDAATTLSTTPDSNVIGQTLFSNSTATTITPGRAELRKMPAVGHHIFGWLEQGSGSNVTTWYGDNGAATKYQSGMLGTVPG